MKQKTSEIENLNNLESEEILFGGIDLSEIEEINKNSTQKILKKCAYSTIHSHLTKARTVSLSERYDLKSEILFCYFKIYVY